MRVPLRVQVSDFDCVPTTLINALAYLFERGDIPPPVLQRVYMLSLDCMFDTHEQGQGTSDLALEFIADWLTDYKSPKFKKFGVEAEYLAEGKLHLGRGNKLVTCLNLGGVAALSVTHFKGYWHQILALRSDSRWLYAFDPHPWPPTAKDRNKRGCYEFLAPEGPREPNLRIHYDWLDTLSDEQPFRLGTRPHRSGVLILRRT